MAKKKQGLWLPTEAVDKVKELSIRYKMRAYDIVLGAYTEGEGDTFEGGSCVIHLGRPLPYTMMKGLASHLRFDMTEYPVHYLGKIKKEIADWPRCSDGRHYQRMKEAYPDANPVMWNLQAVSRMNHTEALLKFGVFNWTPIFTQDKQKQDILANITPEQAMAVVAELPINQLKSLLNL